MTLKIDLAELRARADGRREQKADRAAALRDKGVAVLPAKPRRNYSKIIPGLGRLLPWRRRED